MGNNLPSFECAKRIAYVVADELKTGCEISQPRLVIVADAEAWSIRMEGYRAAIPNHRPVPEQRVRLVEDRMQ